MLDGKLVNCHRTPKGIQSVANPETQLSVRERQFLLIVDKTDSLNQRICAKLAESVDIAALVKQGLLNVLIDKPSASEAKKAPNAAAPVVDGKVDSAQVTKANTAAGRADVNLTAEQSQIAMAATLHDSASEKPVAGAAEADKASPVKTTEAKTKIVKTKVEKKGIDFSVIEAIPDSARLDWAKQTMCVSLRKTSGLLAADLIASIERAKSFSQLKRFTARWRTTMLESKFDKVQIDMWLEQVKYVLENVETTA